MPEFCVKLEQLQCILVFIFRLGAVSEHYPRFGSQNRQQLHVTKSVDLWDNLRGKYLTPTVPHCAINSTFCHKKLNFLELFGSILVKFCSFLVIFWFWIKTLSEKSFKNSKKGLFAKSLVGC